MICHHRSAHLNCEYSITIPTDASGPRGTRKILVIWAKFTPFVTHSGDDSNPKQPMIYYCETLQDTKLDPIR